MAEDRAATAASDTADAGTGAWLGAVGRALDASPEVEAEVLAELATHLEDEAADAMAHGLDPATAERWAIERLGDAAALGRALRRARRRPRAALALAGGGVIAVGGYSLLGVALGMLLVVAADVLARPLGDGVTAPVSSAAPGAYAGFAAVAVGFTWAAHLAPATISSRSSWSVRSVGRALALVLVGVGVPLALLLPGQQLDAWLAVAYPLAPVAAAVAALRAPVAPTLRPGAVTLVAAALVLALPFVAWPADAAGPPTGAQPANAAVLGRPAGEAPNGVMPTASTAWATGGEGGTTSGIRFDDLHGWHDLAIELWPLERAADGLWRYEAGPLLRVPFAFDGLVATADLEYPRPRTAAWFAEVTVGIAPDGVRTLYSGPDVQPTPPWRGSVLAWWGGR